MNTNFIEETYENSRMINPSDYMFSNRVIKIFGEINDELVNAVSEQVNILLHKDADEPIRVLINSIGGSVDAGVAIIDMLNAAARRTKVEVYGIGLNASMAANIFICCGSEGCRFLFPHSTIMLHQVKTGVAGQLSDIEIQASRARKMSEFMYEDISKRTGISTSKLKAICDRDSYFTAPEAVKNKMADKIVEDWLM